MNKEKLVTIILCALFSINLGFSNQALAKNRLSQQQNPVVITSVHGNFNQIWEDLLTALNDKGLVVSSISDVGKMLTRTGKTLKRNKKIFAKTKTMKFCSAVLSRDMLERNPHFIAFCPFEIMVYTLPGEKNKVYLSYRRLIWNNNSNRDILDKAERLMAELINEVIKIQKEYR